MKKIGILLVLAGFLTACNNSASNGSSETIDSLNKREDTLKHNVDSSTRAKEDSLNQHAKNLKQKFDSSIQEKKDSVKKQSK